MKVTRLELDMIELGVEKIKEELRQRKVKLVDMIAEAFENYMNNLYRLAVTLKAIDDVIPVLPPYNAPEWIEEDNIGWGE